jgi:quercetin dioxygenase-like cupin family protein
MQQGVPPGFDPATFDTVPYAQRVEKPWGHELLFTPPGKSYAGKLLHVRAGHRLSLQYHDQKHETILLLHGHALLHADDATGEVHAVEMLPGLGYSIVPGQRHRLEAIEDSDFVEASTPELGITFRIQDDHGRGNETEAVRSAANRGWGERPAPAT